MGYLKKGPRFDLNFHENQLTRGYIWWIYNWFYLLIFFLSIHVAITCERSFRYRYYLHIVLAPKHSLVLVKNLKLWWQCTGACWACAFEPIKFPFIFNGVRQIIVQILLKFNHTLHSWKMVLECIKNITYQILCIRF